MSIEWKSRPKTLVRGRHFVWQGRVKGVSRTLLRQGITLSFVLLQSRQKISLGEVAVNGQGQFLLEGVVSQRLLPKKYRLDVRILTPLRFRRKRTGRPNFQRRERTLRRKRYGKIERKQAGAPSVTAPKRGAEKKQSPFSIPAERRRGPSSARVGRGGKKPKAGGRAIRSPRSTAQPAQVGSGSAKLQSIQKRTQQLLKTLQKGWKSNKRSGESRSLFFRGVTKKPRFLLPPIAPEQGARTRSKGQSPRLEKRTGSGGNGEAKDQSLQPMQRLQTREDRKDRSRQSPRRRVKEASPKGKGLGASRAQGDAPRRENSLEARGSRSNKPGFQVRSEGSPNGTGRRLPTSANGSSRGDAPEQDTSQRGEASSGRRNRSRGSEDRLGEERDKPLNKPSESPKQVKKDSQLPLMVPPLDRSPVPQRRKQRPLHTNRDSLIWNRSRSSNLDLRTNAANTYLRQVFDPYIPHLQRVSVLSKVGREFRLFQEDSPKQLLPVGGRQKVEKRSYFVGRIRAVLWRNRWTPLPSVSPEARVLWYRTKPRVELAFARDAGGLMYIRARRWRASIVRLSWGTDASKSYFGGNIPRGILASQYPIARRPSVPFRVKYIALRRLRRSGVSPGMELHRVLRVIVPYLRGFVGRKLKPHEVRKNRFDTLWRAKVGVCRHRSMLFVIAMQSMGFPARMIGNLAHAFVEFQYPSGRWRQIDLGGADIPNWMGKWRGRKYQPPKDPLPRPPPSAQPKLPASPNPPPHSAGRDVLKRMRSRRPLSPKARVLQGSAKRGERSKRLKAVLIQKRVKKRKKRKPYVPHTKF